MSTTPEELPYWLALLRMPGIGPNHFMTIYEQLPALSLLFATDKPQLKEIGFSAQQQAFIANPPWAEVDKDLRWAEQAGNHIITLADPSYPPLLKETVGPPPVLFAQGKVALLSLPQIAIVGSRHPTHTGREDAFEFAKDLARAGFIITSGLAEGIDGAAHEGALAAPGPTIAVTGCGLDKVYPASHKPLALKIREHGVIVTEYWPGTAPAAENFPRRNRIVSGLCLGTLVVEAALRSGSLITARLAVEQSREVFAIPGSIHNTVARGCHTLIRQGAHLVESAKDIIAELDTLLGIFARPNYAQPPKRLPTKQENPKPPLASEDENLLKCIGFEATGIDQIISRSGLTAAQVSARLILLELAGAILAVSGGYVKAV